jgi:hypothetical protein
MAILFDRGSKNRAVEVEMRRLSRTETARVLFQVNGVVVSGNPRWSVFHLGIW